MPRILSAALLLAMLGGTAQADGREQLIRSVERELDRYVQGVDASTLSTQKLAQIKAIMYSPRSESTKRGLIRSAVGGNTSLRSLLFN